MRLPFASLLLLDLVCEGPTEARDTRPEDVRGLRGQSSLVSLSLSLSLSRSLCLWVCRSLNLFCLLVFVLVFVSVVVGLYYPVGCVCVMSVG